MIKLYDRDGAMVVEILTIVAGLIRADADSSEGETLNRLLSWAPADIDKTHPGISEPRRRFLAHARLKAIIAEVDEQLGRHSTSE